MQIKINQNHFTIRFQMKSAADQRVFLKIIRYRMPKLLQVADRIGNIHDIRFNVLTERTILFTGYFEGNFNTLLERLGKSAGTAFDAVFRHVDNPPPMPVSGNIGHFISWINRNSMPLSYPVTKNLN
jgi:hypothetical protein